MILRRFIIPALLALIVSVLAGWFWLLYTESGARFIWQRVVNASAGGVAAQSVEGDLSSGLRLRQTEINVGGARTNLDAVTLAINIDLLPPLINVEVLRVSDVSVRLPEERGGPDTDAGGPAALPDIALPVRLAVARAEVSKLQIFGAGETAAVTIDQVSFRVDWKEQLQISDFALLASEPQLSLSGALAGTAHRLDVTLAASPYAVSLDANIRDLQVAEITSIRVDHADVTANGNAVITWSDGVNAIGELAVSRASIAALNEQWPDAHPVSLDLAFDYNDTRVTISESQLRVDGTDASIAAAGEINLATGSVDAELAWSRLQWPIDSLEPQVRSDDGAINVQGSIDDWRVDGGLSLAAAGVEDGALSLVGTGNSESLQINIVKGEVLGGTVSGTAAWSWLDEDAWAATLDVAGVQLAALIPELPATLAGHLDLAPGKLAANNLLLTHGSDFVRADGDVLAATGLDFEVEMDDVGVYAADAAGAVQGTGTLSLVNESPYLRFDGASEYLSYQGVEVFDVLIRDVAEKDDALAWELLASELTVGGEHIRDIVVTTRVQQQQQSLGLTFGYGEMHSSLMLDGRFDHWDSPSEWRGQLTALEIGIRDFASVTIDAPAEILLAADQVTVKAFCLRSAGDAALCAQVDWLSGQRFDVAANFDRIPVDIINDFQETGFTFDQLLTGDVAWQRTIGARPTGDAAINLSAGRIRNVDQQDFEVVTEQGRVSFEVVDGKLLSGQMSLPMPGTGSIAGSFAASDVAAGLSSQISGGIDARLTDIGIAAAFTPLIDKASGALQADIDFSGTLGDPRVAGRIEVNAGELHYQPLGMILSEVDVRAEFDDARHINVDGSFRAGEGAATFQTSAAYAASAATGIELQLRGDNLSVINVPDVQAIADADLSLSYNNNELQLGGSLNFPRMHIATQNLSTASATESEDVMIVAGELPQQDVEASSALSVVGELSVALGPDVVVDLGVAEANVAGEAVFTWSGETMPLANGRYDVSGDIGAFGQVLRIEEGGVRFANVPADDPYVRVRAERQIYGNSEIKRAGVLVDGRLPRPGIEAYTNPLTTEERALTLLVTGSDFDYESGAGAIDFGTYIAPRLFVSYGVGIFERDNVISARYDLAKGLGLKATSGQKDSGVDLIYSYEN